jgi:DUF971 family protein
MNAYPIRLERTADPGLVIEWSDGQVRRYTVEELRAHCPCATCNEKRREPDRAPAALPIVSPAELAPLTLAAMKPIGNYAYGIHFSDGHNTGLFTFELLQQLGEPVASGPG